MPVAVDAAERRREIAEATLRITQERGAHAVTIRAVAEEMGHSTAFVTNFIPSRSELLYNALDLARNTWLGERDTIADTQTGVARLVALARWMCSTSEHDTALRSLWVEAVAGAGPEGKLVIEMADRTARDFEASARQTNLERAQEIADILYLYGRGFHMKNVEDPVAWNDERVNRALTVLIDRLFAAGVDGP